MEDEFNRSRKAEIVNLEATTKSLASMQQTEREAQLRADEVQSKKLSKLKADYEAEKKRL